VKIGKDKKRRHCTTQNKSEERERERERE